MRRASLVVALLLLAVAPARADGGDAGQVEYQQLERAFAERPRAETLAALDALPRRHPDSPAAPRALLWRAQLAIVDGDDAGAARRLRALLESYPKAPEARLAERGLGDVALRTGRLDEAERRYLAARAGADRGLAAELTDKLRLVSVARGRRHVGEGALALFLAAAALLGARVLRGRGPLRLPVESLYAAPILALLAASAHLADRRVVPALAIFAAGSLILTTLSGAATERQPGTGRAIALHVALLVAGLAALAYVAAWQGDLIDLLRDTIQPSVE